MSTLNVSNITDGTDTVGTSYVVNGSAKAWSSLNGTGTISLSASFNVSSTSDLGTGNYRFNFTNAMATSNYGLVAVSHAGGVAYTSLSLSKNTSYWQLGNGRTDTFVAIDANQNESAIHGDLA